jgi:hypothetical protein
MKRTLAAFALAPAFAGTFCGIVVVANALSNINGIHLENPGLGIARVIAGGFVYNFCFGAGAGAIFEWTLGILIFLVLRRIKKESLLNYSLMGLGLGFLYGLLCHREGLWLLDYSLFGFSLTAGFWSVRRGASDLQAQRAPNQSTDLTL